MTDRQHGICQFVSFYKDWQWHVQINSLSLPFKPSILHFFYLRKFEFIYPSLIHNIQSRHIYITESDWFSKFYLEILDFLKVKHVLNSIIFTKFCFVFNLAFLNYKTYLFSRKKTNFIRIRIKICSLKYFFIAWPLRFS